MDTSMDTEAEREDDNSSPPLPPPPPPPSHSTGAGKNGMRRTLTPIPGRSAGRGVRVPKRSTGHTYTLPQQPSPSSSTSTSSTGNRMPTQEQRRVIKKLLAQLDAMGEKAIMDAFGDHPKLLFAAGNYTQENVAIYIGALEKILALKEGALERDAAAREVEALERDANAEADALEMLRQLMMDSDARKKDATTQTDAGLPSASRMVTEV